MSRDVPFWELLVHTPAVFVRVANKGDAGYGTWKSIRKMEYEEEGWRRGPAIRMRRHRNREGMAVESSKNHDPCYHLLVILSTTIVV